MRLRIGTILAALPLGAALLQAQPDARLAPCPEGPLFDTLPIAPEEFLAFRPLGFLSVPVHMFAAKDGRR